MFGATEFVASKTTNLFNYGAVATLAAAEGRDYAIVKKELVERARREAPDPNLTSFADTEYLTNVSKEIIFQHPKEYVTTYLLGLNTFWFSGNYHYLLGRYGIIERPERATSFSLVLASEGPLGLVQAVMRTLDGYVAIAIVGKVFWVVVGMLALLGLWVRRRTPDAWVTVLLVAYFSATLIGTTIGVEARHRYALNPLLFAFAAVTVYALYAYYLHRRPRL